MIVSSTWLKGRGLVKHVDEQPSRCMVQNTRVKHVNRCHGRYVTCFGACVEAASQRPGLNQECSSMVRRNGWPARLELQFEFADGYRQVTSLMALRCGLEASSRNLGDGVESPELCRSRILQTHCYSSGHRVKRSEQCEKRTRDACLGILTSSTSLI